MTLMTILHVILFLFIVIIAIKLYRLSNRSKNINWEVKQGVRCYSCKIDITEESDLYSKSIILKNIIHRISKDPKSENFKLCVSCNRNDKLEGIISHKFFNFNRINKIKKYLYSKNVDKVQIIMIVLMIVSNLIDGFIKYYFHINIFIGILFNIFYWFMLYYTAKLSFIEKQKNL
jgi:hypothetical protein